MPGSNSRPNVSEGYEVPTELPGSTGWTFLFGFLVFSEKNPFAGIELTSQRVRGLRGTSELPGRAHLNFSTITCHHNASSLSKEHQGSNKLYASSLIRNSSRDVDFFRMGSKDGELKCCGWKGAVSCFNLWWQSTTSQETRMREPMAYGGVTT